ncbi:hypothetical protein [Serratia symbiotica]
MYALPESCPFRGLFILNPIYSTKPMYHCIPHLGQNKRLLFPKLS